MASCGVSAKMNLLPNIAEWIMAIASVVTAVFTVIMAFTGICSVFIVFVGAVFGLVQLNELKRANIGQSYATLLSHVQNEEIREARGIVFKLEKKSLDEWEDEELRAAAKVCHTYDAVGQMVRHKLLPKDMIISSWGPSLRNSWLILRPLMHKYRKDYDAEEIWDDYEWLAKQAFIGENRRTK
jgi:hypothetical protein